MRGGTNAAPQNPIQPAFAQKHELNIVSTLGRLQQASPADRLNRLPTYRHQKYQSHHLKYVDPTQPHHIQNSCRNQEYSKFVSHMTKWAKFIVKAPKNR